MGLIIGAVIGYIVIAVFIGTILERFHEELFGWGTQGVGGAIGALWPVAVPLVFAIILPIRWIVKRIFPE